MSFVEISKVVTVGLSIVAVVSPHAPQIHSQQSSQAARQSVGRPLASDKLNFHFSFVHIFYSFVSVEGRNVEIKIKNTKIKNK